jgi:hypothetical protein
MSLGADDSGSNSVWAWLSREERDLEGADLVAINLSVARDVPSLTGLGVKGYCRTVDDWARKFASVLPAMEREFAKTPARWKNDVRFFRVGMLQGFLGQELGVEYIQSQKGAQSVDYLEPSQLFINGVIDSRRGTCANMPLLHVAISQRLGWPVSLASVKSHFISRFDDGSVVHNIEATSTHPGHFASDPDEVYIRRFDLPRKAISCGSDLRCLSMREMIGVFLGLRGRHYQDVEDFARSERDYCLARAFAPNHRATFLGSIHTMLGCGARLFERWEQGHPASLVPSSNLTSFSENAAVEFVPLGSGSSR